MRMLSTIQPTQHQLTVLAIIAANQEKPLIARKLLSHNQNLIAARNLLMQWNAVEVSTGKITLTDIGRTIAIDNNIIDDSGQLTDDGQQLLPTEVTKDIGEPVDIEPTGDMGLGSEPLPQMEGFSDIFKSALLG
jgi:hypothetical protein